jgi:hypothetical protein
MVLFSSTDFDEIIFFRLSKDQTLKIKSTFGNPEQFLILVTPLLLSKNNQSTMILFNNGVCIERKQVRISSSKVAQIF